MHCFKIGGLANRLVCMNRIDLYLTNSVIRIILEWMMFVGIFQLHEVPGGKNILLPRTNCLNFLSNMLPHLMLWK